MTVEPPGLTGGEFALPFFTGAASAEMGVTLEVSLIVIGGPRVAPARVARAAAFW